MRMLLTAALLVAALPMAAALPVTSGYNCSGQGTVQVTVQAAPATLNHVDSRMLDFGVMTSSSAIQKFTIAPTDAKADLFKFTKDFNEVATIKVDDSCSVLMPGDVVLNPKITGNTVDSLSGEIAVGGTFTLSANAKKAADYYQGYIVTLSYTNLY